MSKEAGLKLSRRKALAGLGGIGVAASGAGLGTSAYFSDEETFEGNSITAGKLDLSVTWQQLYYGAPQNRRPDDYGDAERPFVNAYPDHDGNGLQSFERADGEDKYVNLDAYDDPAEAAKAGTNLEFTCEEIATFDEPSFAPNSDALIELDDVKPGDSGEVTFGVKLCDNPGCVWLTGDLVGEADGGHPESDGPQLADEIRARAWYDTDGDNEYDTNEPLIADGSLRDVLDRLEGGVLLDYDAKSNQGMSADGITLTDDDCEVVAGNPSCDDYGLTRAIKVESEELPDSVDASKTYSTSVGDVTITVRKMADDVREFDFDLDGFEVRTVIVKGGSAANVCQRPDDDGGYLTASSGEGLAAPPNQNNDQRHGVSHVSFCYDTVPPEELPQDDPTCFEPSNTRFIGFEWTLPISVGNEVQGDSVAFDLGFYTEQSRHNDNPEGPPESTD